MKEIGKNIFLREKKKQLGGVKEREKERYVFTEKKLQVYVHSRSVKIHFTHFFSKGRPLSYILKDNRYQES